MEKIDFKKELRDFYNNSSEKVIFLDIPQMNFIVIEGHGAPESESFKQSIEALYPIAYGIKFKYKKENNIDFKVMPLEGLWWADDMSAYEEKNQARDEWKWNLMIMQPHFITKELFDDVKQGVIVKKQDPFLDKVVFKSFLEGKSAQIMHIGPYSSEGPNIKKIHSKIIETGGRLSGKHHEIYLSDARRSDPSKLKTILRQPFVI